MWSIFQRKNCAYYIVSHARVICAFNLILCNNRDSNLRNFKVTSNQMSLTVTSRKMSPCYCFSWRTIEAYWGIGQCSKQTLFVGMGVPVGDGRWLYKLSVTTEIENWNWGRIYIYWNIWPTLILFYPYAVYGGSLWASAYGILFIA